MKTQLVNTYNEWTNYQRQHAFVVPNVEMKYSPVASGPFKLSVSYAYTGHVDQNLSPCFKGSGSGLVINGTMMNLKFGQDL